MGVATPDLARQLLNARQLDEINVNLVPVLLGGGVALFANLASAPIRLHGPTVIEGTGVTHLNYRVTYSRPRGHPGAGSRRGRLINGLGGGAGPVNCG